jgi:ribosomal protein S27E
MEVEIDNEPTNVIYLHETPAWVHGKCRHHQIIVDKELATVKCKQCEAELNPIAMLARMAKEQSTWLWRNQEYRENFQKMKEADLILEKKHRCKCEHCGQMTKIYRNILTVVK